MKKKGFLVVSAGLALTLAVGIGLAGCGKKQEADNSSSAETNGGIDQDELIGGIVGGVIGGILNGGGNQPTTPHEHKHVEWYNAYAHGLKCECGNFAENSIVNHTLAIWWTNDFHVLKCEDCDYYDQRTKEGHVFDINYQCACGYQTSAQGTLVQQPAVLEGNGVVTLPEQMEAIGTNGVLTANAGTDVELNPQTGTTITAKQETPNSPAVAVWANGGKITVNGGKYTQSITATKGRVGFEQALIYASHGGKVVINGGEFIAVKDVNATLVTDGGEIIVKGGKFYRFDPTSYLADGYKAEKEGDWYQVVALDFYASAEVEDTYYIRTKKGLIEFADSVNVDRISYANKTVALLNDIDLLDVDWTPIGQTGATLFMGTFDGRGKTVSNLNVNSLEEAYEHYSSGLFGWIEGGAGLKNLTVDGGVIKGHHNVAALVGAAYNTTIENCHVKNVTVVNEHEDDGTEDSATCGDKAGLLVGYSYSNVSILDCSGENSSVSAGRDGGQLVGAGYTASIQNCIATGVTVTANGSCTGANIREELIGRVLG